MGDPTTTEEWLRKLAEHTALAEQMHMKHDTRYDAEDIDDVVDEHLQMIVFFLRKAELITPSKAKS